MIIYPDPETPGAEIRLNNGCAWRRLPDGREEILSEAEEDAWYERLAEDNRHIEARA